MMKPPDENEIRKAWSTWFGKSGWPAQTRTFEGFFAGVAWIIKRYKLDE